MRMMTRVMALIVKEFLAILKDPKSRFVLIGPPIIQMFVFGYAATYDLKHVPFAVYNEDTSEPSRQLIARFRGSDNFELRAIITDNSQISPLIDSKKVLLVLHLDPRFSRELLAGRTVPVQVIIDGRDSNTALIALGYVQNILTSFSEMWTAAQGHPAAASVIVNRAWFNANLESRWSFVPGIVGLLSVVVTVNITGLAVARERERGTFDQLLVTPLRPGEILIGKTVPSFVIGFGEATVIIIFAVLWFHVPLRGSLLTLYTGLALFLLSTIGVGLMISSLAATMQQALLGSFLFLVPAITLSGFTTPIANMPKVIQYLTLANPMRYFIVIVREVFLEGRSFGGLINQFWPMGLIGVLTLAAAGWLFRHRLY